MLKNEKRTRIETLKFKKKRRYNQNGVSKIERITIEYSVKQFKHLKKA